MHITELRIAGFKSFVDPQSMPVEPGLTGIVGPNGCGKSNLLEALRWAMGANSARAMRGGEMDDLIFSGTQARPARETAEVTLVIDNSDRTAPPEFNASESLEIERRLKRGAGSSYRINGRTVRGKDIQLLFADASTGANSPALVRQGQISELISSKPQNRRRILEEAAGIAGLNTRRHEAEARLDAAEANLERLSELTGEMERQLTGLRRQAARARRYHALSQEISGLEALLVYQHWSQARAGIEAASDHVETLKKTAGEMAQEAGARERASREAGEALPGLREGVAEIAGRLSETRIALARLEAEYRNAREAEERLTAEDTRLASDLERETIACAEARAAHESALCERGRLGEEDDEHRARREQAAHSDLEEARRSLAAAETETDRIRESLSEIRARRRAAEEAHTRDMRRREDLSAEIGRLRGEMTGLEDTAIHVLRVRQARNAEAEALAALHDAERAVELAETDLHAAREAQEAARVPAEAALQALRVLQAEIAALEKLCETGMAKEGASPVLSRMQVEPGYEKAIASAFGDEVSASSEPDAAIFWAGAGISTQPLPAGAQPLSQYVSVPEELGARLAQCGLVRPADGPGLASQLRPGQRLVSVEGHLWRWDGLTRTPEAPLSAAARLEQAVRLEAARAQMEQRLSAQAAAGAALAGAGEKRARAEEHLRHVQSLMAPAQARLHEARLLAAQSIQSSEHAAQRRDAAIRSLERAEGELALLESAASPVCQDGSEEETEAQARLEAALSQLTQARNRETEARGKSGEARHAREQAEARLRALDLEIANWAKRIEAARQRLSALAERRADIAASLLSARERPAALENQIEGLNREAAELERAHAAAADQLASCEADAREAASRARRAEADLAGAREQLAAWTVKLETAERQVAEAAERSRSLFDCAPESLSGLAAQHLGTQFAEEIPAADMQARLETCRRERDQLGGVNMNAAQEAGEIEARLASQTRERDDLTGAISRLRQGIETLNGEGRGRLQEAFERVNQHFQALFMALFNGGQAELRLVDADDPLRAGLEIFAQPPGKKLGTLNLMSGGEQALTATALIFAVFLARPAPICVLDEVDAPLDDANVDRFCNMLNEMRQRTETRFVVITHNPVTMSRMDRLFGVTMRERGVSRLVSVDLAGAEQLIAAE